MVGYRINIYVHDYKLAVKIDENGHSDRNINFEIKGQKAIEQELGFKILTKKTSIFLKLSMKYLGASNNRLINLLKKP